MSTQLIFLELSSLAVWTDYTYNPKRLVAQT